MLWSSFTTDEIHLILKNYFNNNPENKFGCKQCRRKFGGCSFGVHKILQSLVRSKYLLHEKKYGYHTYALRHKPAIKKQNEYLFSALRAIDEDLTFGVEFEFVSKLDGRLVAKLFGDLNLQHGIEGHGEYVEIKRRKYENWLITSDASLNDTIHYPECIEIVSPILKGKEGLKELLEVTRLLKILKISHFIKQDRSCGTHVYHGTFHDHYPISKLIKQMEYTQPFFNKLVSQHRILNDDDLMDVEDYETDYDYVYIGAVKLSKYKSGKKIKYNHDRFLNLNITKFRKKGVVEFRQLQGTIDFKVITSWIIIGQKLVKRVKSIVRPVKSMFDFFKYLGIYNPLIRNGCRKVSS